MSFLSAALFGILVPLAALPLIIHLLNKGFPQRFQFPTIEWIRGTMAQRSKLHRWRHWILLLLRTCFLALLLFAFLLPVLNRFGTNPAARGKRDLLIVFDHSASMEHKGDGPTSRERAVHEASKLIDSLNPADTVNVLLMGAEQTTCFVGPSNDHDEAKRFLNKVGPGFGRADITQANSLAARLVAQSGDNSEIYYISDFQRKNWANADFTALPPRGKLFFVEVAPSRRDNHALLNANVAQSQILAGDTVTLEVSVGNYSSSALSDRIKVVIDGRFSFEQDIALSPWSEGKVLVPVSPGGPGLHLCEVRLPPDALEHDDHFFLTLAVQEKEEVLIVADGSKESTGAAYFLETALNPYEHQAGSLLPRTIGSSDLSPSRLAGVHKLFLTGVNRLGAESTKLLAEFLFRGGGAIYFLDGPADLENLSGLEKLIGDLPLRLTERRNATNVASGAQQFVRGDFRSPYLKLFQGTARQNLALLEFYDYYQAAATGSGNVLLSYADESPAVSAVHHGLGTLLLLNFSVNELSSNLARQRIFPAWIQELVKAVSAEQPPRAAYAIGETVDTEVWRNELRGESFIDPAGKPVTVKRDLSGERYRITFTPDRLGFYKLGSPALYAFGVNTSPDEADLRPMDKEVLPKEFADQRSAHYVAGAEAFDELARGRPLFHWFVLAALVMVVFESAFQLLLRKKVA